MAHQSLLHLKGGGEAGRGNHRRYIFNRQYRLKLTRLREKLLNSSCKRTGGFLALRQKVPCVSATQKVAKQLPIASVFDSFRGVVKKELDLQVKITSTLAIDGEKKLVLPTFEKGGGKSEELALKNLEKRSPSAGMVLF